MEDGTEIDDSEYFDSLQNQSVLYLSTEPKFFLKGLYLEFDRNQKCIWSIGFTGYTGFTGLIGFTILY